MADAHVTSLFARCSSRRWLRQYFVPAADISGEIPDGLVGTFFRNGPGINEVFGQKLNHPIDGDGVICALTFLPVTAAGSGHGDAKKKVHFRSRFVRSEHRIKEEYARKFMFRGQMGTQSTSWIKDTITTMKESVKQQRTGTRSLRLSIVSCAFLTLLRL